MVKVWVSGHYVNKRFLGGGGGPGGGDGSLIFIMNILIIILLLSRQNDTAGPALFRLHPRKGPFALI